MPTVPVDFADLAQDDLILCATHRLVRHLRRLQGDASLACGRVSWRPLNAKTLAQWLEAAAAEALLCGRADPAEAPRRVLTPAQERALWERVIAADLGEEGGELFDLEGLAAAACDANILMEAWGVALPANPASGSEESRRFKRWRAEFRRRCQESGWLEAVRATAWRAGLVAAGAVRLPARVVFAGFDRYTPQEEVLRQALNRQGVATAELVVAGCPAQAGVAAFADRRAECRAAAAWAAARLEAQPDARLAIVVPALAAVRDLLADALDAALQPRAFALGAAQAPRRHNFSLGLPLARQPMVAVALALLRLAANPKLIEQADFGELLRGPYWSADLAEADLRARLEARLRQRLPPSLSLPRLLRFLRREAGSARLVADLAALAERSGPSVRPALQWPSAWGAAFRRWLDAAGWPGERPLSSHEYQARQALEETLDGLSDLDAVLGQIGAGEAVSRFARLCRERVFQPETEGDPPVQVMGPLEAAGGRFHAIWMLGMNDDVWPPSPRPNPLLPAEAQRRARSPASGAEVEAAFAAAIQSRLLASAPEAVFSWAKNEGDRLLRPSPLLAGFPQTTGLAGATPVEPFGMAGDIETLADHQGPPLAPGEVVGGGADLLRAQALCPAWAFYRYRLGARALEVPVEGLDARARGTLLHLTLEEFWRDRGRADLLAMDETALARRLGECVDLALGKINQGREEPLPARLWALEQGRLTALLRQWLALEAARGEDFRVVGRERQEAVEVAGLRLNLRVDRIDELPDGRRLILDYKSRRPAAPGWNDERITEPQLPFYAAFAPEAAAVAGVAFAQVRRDDMGFSGEAAEEGLLPRLKAQENWPARLALWRERLTALAAEVSAGWAPVSYLGESRLRYCDVLPLLRLPEARAWRGTADGEEEE